MDNSLISRIFGRQPISGFQVCGPILTEDHDWNSAGIFLLDDVLTTEECETLVHMAQHKHSGAWEDIFEGEEDRTESVRKCQRIMWDSREVMTELWSRVAGRVPGLLTWSHKDESWTATRLNERMRFVKYSVGDFFRAHSDCSYETPDGRERSFLTLCLYLNDGSKGRTLGQFTGGATVFYPKDMGKSIRIVPKVGRVVIFPQEDLLHAGEEVTDGTKLIMRTDFMYKRAQEHSSNN